MSNAAEIVQQLVAKINQHDVQGIVALLTPDHSFTDSLGRTVQGPSAMQDAWKGYFAMMPDYQITVDHCLDRDGLVLLAGTARGTYAVNGQLLAENRWSIPAAWRATVVNGRIREWQVYCDTRPTTRS
jgi:ketosteroid isomerase-like protein